MGAFLHTRIQNGRIFPVVQADRNHRIKIKSGTQQGRGVCGRGGGILAGRRKRPGGAAAQ